MPFKLRYLYVPSQSQSQSQSQSASRSVFPGLLQFFSSRFSTWNYGVAAPRHKAARALPAIVCGGGSDVWRFVFWVDAHSKPGRDGCGKPHIRTGGRGVKEKKENSTTLI